MGDSKSRLACRRFRVAIVRRERRSSLQRMAALLPPRMCAWVLLPDAARRWQPFASARMPARRHPRPTNLLERHAAEALLENGEVFAESQQSAAIEAPHLAACLPRLHIVDGAAGAKHRHETHLCSLRQLRRPGALDYERARRDHTDAQIL